jgi:hypothetical protein
MMGGAEVRKTTILCDNCAGNISPEVTGFPHKFILSLRVEDVATSSGTVYGVSMSPPFSGGEKNFCGLECLRKWCIQEVEGRG